MGRRARFILIVVAAAAVAVAVARWPRARAPAPGATAPGHPTATTATPPAPTRAAPRPARDPDPPGALGLEGLVLDERDQPVPGATVELASRPPRAVTTDRDGAFAFAGLLPSAYQVTAWHQARYAAPVRLVVRATTEPLILRLVVGHTLAVRVVDDATAAPVAGAIVDDGRLAVATGVDGVAALGGRGPSFYAVAVQADGYAPALLTGALPDDPGGTTTQEVRLARGAPVRGHVLGVDGAPAADVRVTAASDGGEAEATTDAAGTWTIPRLAAGRYVFAVDAAAGLGRVEVDLDGATAPADVTIRLTRGATLTGVVVDAAGAPVAQATVTAQRTATFDERHATTDAAGQFAIAGLAAATLAVFATRGPDASAVTTVELATSPGPLRLTLAPAMIAGVVVDAAGQPVPEARVMALPDGAAAALVHGADVADGAGRFELGPLTAGSRYRLQAAWPDAPMTNQYLTPDATTAVAGARDVRLELPAAGAIRGVVTRDGRPVERFAIALASFEPGLAFAEPEARAAADGRFTRAAVPPGTWVVRIVGADFVGRTLTDVEVTAGQTTDLGAIAVEAGAVVRGRVVDAAGAPVADAAVTMAPRLTMFGARFGLGGDPRQAALLGTYAATTDADGGFAFAGVAAPRPERPLRIVAHHPRRGLSATAAVAVPAAPLVLALGPSGAIAGAVRGATARAAVEITPADGGYQVIAVVGPDGRFHAPQVGVGPAQLIVKTRGPGDQRASAPVTATVVAGQTATVDLALPAP